MLVVNPRPISVDGAQWPQVKLKFVKRKKASSHSAEVSQVPPAPSSCSSMRLKNKPKKVFLENWYHPKERCPGNLTDIQAVGDEHRQHAVWNTDDFQEVPCVCTYLLKHAKLPKLGKQPNVAPVLQTGRASDRTACVRTASGPLVTLRWGLWLLGVSTSVSYSSITKCIEYFHNRKNLIFKMFPLFPLFFLNINIYVNAWHHLNLSNKMEEDSIKFHTGQIECKCSPLCPTPEEIEPIKINTRSETNRSYQISLLATQSNVYCDF